VRDLPLDVSSVRLSAKARRGFDVRAVEVIARGLCDTCVAEGA
jgi:Fe2+ or Zn2+ uptake regulation protein